LKKPFKKSQLKKNGRKNDITDVKCVLLFAIEKVYEPPRQNYSFGFAI
tara:strand:- start:30 stop:173 length:144 start_codon:yes stop_codon:yes gene_type:complete